MFILKQKDRLQFLSIPESGMGYQIVEITFVSPKLNKKSIHFSENEFMEKCLVINSTYVFRYDDDFEKTLSNIDFKNLSENTEPTWHISYKCIKSVKLLVTRETYEVKEPQTLYKKSKTNIPANQAPIDKTDPFDCFIRFSAFYNDRRVDLINRLVYPGTYATTCEDAAYCMNNRIDPRERYSLPNPMPIEYYFRILPDVGTPVQMGKVQPAFGHTGGGIEVLFSSGTSPGTIWGAYKL